MSVGCRSVQFWPSVDSCPSVEYQPSVSRVSVGTVLAECR